MESKPERLKTDAAKCRDRAATAVTDEARSVLDGLAARYEHAAALADAVAPKGRPAIAAFNWLDN